MKRDIFVETNQVTALRDAVSTALEAGEGYPAMVMAYGEAGTGKTRAARSLYSEHLGFYVRVMEGMTQAGFLQEVCLEVTGSRPNESMRCKSAIISSLRSEPAPLFIDEADRLHVSRMEDLRDIHDATGSPVILIGEMGLPTRVNARSRINDRIPDAFRVLFGEISRADVHMYAAKAAGLNLSLEAGQAVLEATKGNFRRVHNAILSIEGAARAKGTSEIDVELARAALGGSQRRRLG